MIFISLTGIYEHFCHFTEKSFPIVQIEWKLFEIFYKYICMGFGKAKSRITI